MTALIHVLGSDIPHHNQTVLRFFNDELAADDEQARGLWSSVMEQACVKPTRRCHLLSRERLAQAVIARGKSRSPTAFSSTAS
jgi:dTDP-N-acetylfucosamine:lipid II N-acetylfucosaminyltransferase